MQLETKKKGRAAKKRSDTLMTGLQGTTVHAFKESTSRGAQENLSRAEQQMLLNEQEQFRQFGEVINNKKTVEMLLQEDRDWDRANARYYRRVSPNNPMQDPWRRTTPAYLQGKARKAQAQQNKRARRALIVQARPS